MKRVTDHPLFLERVQAAINPGESIKAVHEFFLLDNECTITSFTQVIRIVLVMSGKYIYSMSFKTTSKKDLVLAGSTMTPISKISSVSVAERRLYLSPFGKNVLVISIWGEGILMNVASNDINYAKDFVTVLKSLTAQKEALQGTKSISEELEKLSQLNKEGILTDNDMEKAKELFLGRTPEKTDQSMMLLRNINELRRQGVLTEMEFNMKKWDILSGKGIK